MKLRGVAGELMFVVEGVELPGGLQIAARQVDAAGKVIDFALRDASGARALLEVKAWTARRWTKELAVNATRKNPTNLIGHLVNQLNAAKSTGQPVYLAVTDAIKARLPQIRQVLAKHAIEDVEIVTFPEARLGDVSRTLRKGLGLAGSAALVTADQIAKEEADDTND